jgi:hypothetical protein
MSLFDALFTVFFPFIQQALWRGKALKAVCGVSCLLLPFKNLMLSQVVDFVLVVVVDSIGVVETL